MKDLFYSYSVVLIELSSFLVSQVTAAAA